MIDLQIKQRIYGTYSYLRDIAIKYYMYYYVCIAIKFRDLFKTLDI